MDKDHKGTHPGIILLHEFLEPAGISRNALARAMYVPSNRVIDIVNGKRGISAETAVRLSLALPATTPEYWLGLQNEYDLLSIDVEKIRGEVLSLADK